MTSTRLLHGAAPLIMAAVCAPYTPSALAQTNIPAVIPFQGFLADAKGAAIDRPEDGVQMRFTFYAGLSTTDELYSELQTVPVDAGRFVALVGNEEPLPLGLFRDNAEVWVQVEVDGDDELPRFQLGAVPFAATANYAHQTTWAGIQGVPAGIEDGDDVLSRGTVEDYARGVCFDSEAELTGALDDTYVRNGAFLPQGSNLACTGSEKVRGIDPATGDVLCGPDAGGAGTLYTAASGGGLALAGTAFSIAANGVQSANLANNSVSSVKILDGTVSGADLAASTIDSSHIIDGSILAADLATNSVRTNKLASGSVTAPKLNLNEGAGAQTYVLSPGTQWLFPLSFVAIRNANCHVFVHAQSEGTVNNSSGWSLQIARRVADQQTAFAPVLRAVEQLNGSGASASGSWRVPIARNDNVELGVRVNDASGQFGGAELELSVSYFCI